MVRAALILMVLAALVTFRRPLFQGNFGVVEPGTVYRAAQPQDDLRRWVRMYHLASILNLRGGSKIDPWYVSEVRVAHERGVAFYDLPMSATRRPTRRELLILLDLFEHCRYPLLIHCKSGSDRTGLASALYVMARRGAWPEQAIRAFSLGYGHVPIGGPEHLHEPFHEYNAWLKVHRLPHTLARLRSWVEHEYRADDPAINVPPLPPGPRVRVSAGGRPSKS